MSCAKTIPLTKSEEYNDRTVHIMAKDGVKYELGPGWKTDSLQNISGIGFKIANDSSAYFKGSIPSSEIEQLTFVDNVTPAFILIASLSAIWLIIRAQ
jgi:hypothetical protein